MRIKSIIDMMPDSPRDVPDFFGQVHCPIKTKFSRAWDAFKDGYNAAHEPGIQGIVPLGGCGVDINFNISTAASPEKLPAIITDSGYSEFFTGGFLSSPEKMSWFASRPLPEPVHPLFRNLDLRDPRGIFSIYGAMPYVLLVNHNRLKGRPAPRRIADLSAPEYESSVGVGFAPDDISELLLLEIWKEQGEEGIRALAHTAGFIGRAPEMAANAVGNRDGCCVYFISWFFAHAVPKREYLEIVWPDDGAVLDPMYAVMRRDLTAPQKDCGDFLFGETLGKTMAEGWFAHVNGKVRHPAPEGAFFRWPGWDYLYEKDIPRRVQEIEAVFYDERRKIPAAKPA
ncbi:MAG: ABC transporter substrate-binding protein [Treponema sp.]|jgi:ABC-type Fe3+ transport system substrate-binding protein|nr:ABC transporter substrate-binding protein [Treponema sp.]